MNEQTVYHSEKNRKSTAEKIISGIKDFFANILVRHIMSYFTRPVTQFIKENYVNNSDLIGVEIGTEKGYY